MMNKAQYKKYLPFLVFCILAFVPQEMKAQTFQYPQVFDFWIAPGNLHAQMLKKKGFSEVYGGPKKQGGALHLYHHKTAKEYLFIHYTDSGETSSITYYLPTKAKYLNLQPGQKNLKNGEKISPHGTTTYNDGKKYYQISFTLSSR